MRTYEGMNELIADVLGSKKELGFHHEAFVPREAIALVRKWLMNETPRIFTAGMYNPTLVHAMLAKYQDSFDTLMEKTPLYSGVIQPTGRLHIYKSEEIRIGRMGDIIISAKYVDDVMSAIFHDDWKQTTPRGTFTFDRQELKHIQNILTFENSYLYFDEKGVA